MLLEVRICVIYSVKSLKYLISKILINKILAIFCTAECNITSISSTAASSLLVKWNSFPSATSYFLNVSSVVNSTIIAPVFVQLPSSSTEKVVQGLRPGHSYIVTLKVFQFYYVMCINSQTALTGKFFFFKSGTFQASYLLHAIDYSINIL